MEETVLKIIDTLHDLGKTVRYFNKEDSQQALDDLMYILNNSSKQYIAALAELDQQRKQQTTQVPNQIIEFVHYNIRVLDRDMNPDLHVHSVLQTAVSKNQKLHGRKQMMEKFKGDLEQEIEKAFPGLMKE